MPRFPEIVRELRTARAWGVPHGTLRFGRKKWTPVDRVLALALTEYEDGLCSGCGHPRDRAWNEDMEGWYTAHRATCQSCQAASLEQDRNGARKAAETIYVTDDSPDGFAPDPRMAHKG